MSAYESEPPAESAALSVLDRVQALEVRVADVALEHRRLLEFVVRLARVVGIDAPKDL